MRTFQLVFLLGFLFASCTDEVETQGQLAAKKLKADLASHFITDIDVRTIDGQTLIFSGSVYKITSSGFIVITTTTGSSATFNLGELKSYVIFQDTLYLYY